MDKKVVGKLGINDVIAYIIGGLSVVFALYIIIFLEKGYYHADCMDSLMWAEASYDAGTLLNPDFSYAAIMPIAGNVIMWPLVAIFGVSMQAQIIGLVVFFLLFSGSVVWLCKQLGFRNDFTVYTLSIILIFVSSSEKLREIFWGHIIYYSFGALMFLSVFAAALKVYHQLEAREQIKSNKKILVLLFVISLICGINGTQIAAISSIPIFITLLAYLFFESEKKMNIKENRSVYIPAAVVFGGTIIGIICFNILSKGFHAGYEEAYSKFTNLDAWSSNFLKIPESIFSLMGVDITNASLLYSQEGIINICKIIGIIFLFATPVAMLFQYKKLKKMEYKCMLLAHHFMAMFIMIGWIFGLLSSANWRLSPLIVSASLCCIVYISNVLENMEFRRKVIVVIIPLVILGCLTVRSALHVEKQSASNKALENVAKYLEQNHLTYGYSCFWNANIITMMSGSKVIVRDVDLSTPQPTPSNYQVNKHWYGEADGYDKYFVLMSTDEYNQYYLKTGSSGQSVEMGSVQTYETPQSIDSFENFMILIYDHNIF